MTELQTAKAEVARAKANLAAALANVEFARMTASEKRVAIAKDVIAWLNTGKIKASPGTYLEVTKAVSDEATGDTVGIQKCNACALGAVFACAVEKVPTINLADAEEWGNEYAPEKMQELLSPYFSTEQLYTIENAFERAVVSGLEGDNEYEQEWCDLTKRALAFNKGVRSKKERLVRIMKNIIRNGGEFRP